MEGSAKLIIQQGPTPGTEFNIAGEAVTIGREAPAEILIPVSGVSRRHARITHQGEQYLLQDLGSTNGTFLNEKRVYAGQLLHSGDVIGLGQSVRLVFQAGVPAQSVQGSATALEPTNPPPRSPPPAAVAAEPIAPAAAGGVGATVLGEAFDQTQAPPQLTVTYSGTTRMYTLGGTRISIGRVAGNDIVIASKIISRSHAHLEHQEDGGYQLVVNPQAGNPVILNGRPVAGPTRLRHEDKMRVGGRDPGLMVTMTYLSPAEASAGVESIYFGQKTEVQIGRDPTNDVVLNVPQVSRYHAVIERIGQRYRVRDLRSTNGTFVNDQQITTEVWLKPKDTIRIGAHRFVMGEDSLDQYDESNGLRVEAVGLNKWVRKDLNILKDISLVFQPREFIVVVGQSGGGKSTLVDAIAGYRPATHGGVFVNDIEVYKNFDAIRNNIGFVPQKDIIHMELTVFQALDYAAQLRMPPDTSKAERHQRVMEVLEDLDLKHRKDVQISGLSGGQQKRVSIGVELLTKPGLFFLDEPTSGLDPGTETALMQLMRRLADQGRTIVLITHATKNVMLADKVVFLARGGFLVWFGPPDEALAYFDQFRSERDRRAREIEFDEIYALLDDPQLGSPEEWARRFHEHPANQNYIRQPLQNRSPAASPAPRPAANVASGSARKVSGLRQFLILSSRNLKILTRDRFALALMLAAAPLVGLLDVVLSLALGRNPFAQADGNMQDVLIILFLIAIYGVMIGGLSQMREIVKEADIYKRERLVNLKIIPYIFSKIWVALLLSLYQAGWYVLIRYLAFDMPGGFIEALLIYTTVALATMAGAMLGLFASALAPNANSAPLIVILLMIPQIVMGGALIPLPGLLTAPFTTRWAFESSMAITGVGSDIAKDACWALPDELRTSLTLEEKNQRCNCQGTNALRAETCNFPGLGEFANEAINQPRPPDPPPEPVRPPDPVFPEPPAEPENQADTVAVAEYLEALQAFQDEVDRIEADYRAEIAEFEQEVALYRIEAETATRAQVEWQVAQAQAVEPAEGLINQFNRLFGWTFVNKNDAVAYYGKIALTWVAQGVIMSVLIVGILILQKRKDKNQ